MHKKERNYKESVQEDLYQFEMGNELGAHLEKEKNEHRVSYQKKSLEDHLYDLQAEDDKELEPK